MVVDLFMCVNWTFCYIRFQHLRVKDPHWYKIWSDIRSSLDHSQWRHLPECDDPGNHIDISQHKCVLNLKGALTNAHGYLRTKSFYQLPLCHTYAVFCNILRAHLVLGKILNLVSKIIFALRQFCWWTWPNKEQMIKPGHRHRPVGYDRLTRLAIKNWPVLGFEIVP